MPAKVIRDIIVIDGDKCDGCGNCLLACAEGAIQIIGGKARLISDKYCDGLGACIGECPQGALTIEKRESEDFDEDAVAAHLGEKAQPLPCGCPGSSVQQFSSTAVLPIVDMHPCSEHQHQAAVQQSMLTHWPVQLTLVPSNARFLKGADLLLAAHCAPFAYGGFHADFIRDRAVVCACPKLDDANAHQEKLNELLRQSDINSVTVVRMEVPCCGGLSYIVQNAIEASGKDIPSEEVVIGIKGDILH